MGVGLTNWLGVGLKDSMIFFKDFALIGNGFRVHENKMVLISTIILSFLILPFCSLVTFSWLYAILFLF